MVIEHHVRGYDSFVEFMKKFKGDDLVHVYFSGDKLPSGDSWCSDCIRGNIIDILLEKNKSIYCI